MVRARLSKCKERASRGEETYEIYWGAMPYVIAFSAIETE